MSTNDIATEHEALLRSQIEAAGKTSEVAPQLLELAVRTWTTWQNAQALLESEGIVLTTAHGSVAHPAAQIARQSCATYTQLLGRMGLSATPTARAYKANRPLTLAPVTSISELMARKPAKVARPS